MAKAPRFTVRLSLVAGGGIGTPRRLPAWGPRQFVQIPPRTWKSPRGFSTRASFVAGAGFETAWPRFSSLLMAHDFWSQVLHQQALAGRQFVLGLPPLFSRLLPSSGDIVERVPREVGEYGQ